MPTRRSLLRRTAGVVAVGGFGSLLAGSRRSERRESGDSAAEPASVLVAGSLQSVAKKVGTATVEAHGSVACRRLLEDGLRDPDAVALADPRLFEGLAERATCFATNALVVAHRRDSPVSEKADWRAVVGDDSLAVGRTDPARDPLGYRTVMALRLADGVDAAAALARTKLFPETALLRTLEAGGIDAAFAYRNMAVEHDLPYLELPDEIDFSNPAFEDRYAAASVELPERTVRGAPIRYAAVGPTDRGERWVENLANAGATLREAGFGVPEAYPKALEL
ncbi:MULTISPECIES: substrate-binding domain-containing protein [Halorussus]|uniref:substrate-binding domain-containing protein n=1 Tax=Halorussus TaxID=1070314 RepID=UPI0020A0DA3F|nr:substrate-binding domain-containing protein [Halorussus vallis]USZ76309.1 substrate-binding domain-containing protein [Halorussus vallis]